MMDDQKLTAIFGKFAGREVSVTETSGHYRLPGGYRGQDRVPGGKVVQYTNVKLNNDDPTTKEISSAAEENGLTVRVCLPGTFGTMDYCEDRLNVSVGKDGDGKYRVKGFGIS